jgi:hypothetical protein
MELPQPGVAMETSPQDFACSLPPGPPEGQAQQVPGLDMACAL